MLRVFALQKLGSEQSLRTYSLGHESPKFWSGTKCSGRMSVSEGWNARRRRSERSEAECRPPPEAPGNPYILFTNLLTKTRTITKNPPTSLPRAGSFLCRRRVFQAARPFQRGGRLSIRILWRCQHRLFQSQSPKCIAQGRRCRWRR